MRSTTMSQGFRLALVCYTAVFTPSFQFQGKGQLAFRRRGPQSLPTPIGNSLRAAGSDDNDAPSSDKNLDKNQGMSWTESFNARKEALREEKLAQLKKWCKADCSSAVSVTLPDWIRRLDVAEWPFAACGSSSGSVYIANLETGNLIASNVVQKENDSAHQKGDAVTPIGLEETLRLLYGDHDGGGTFAMTFSGNLICEAGRSGGVNLWRLDSSSQHLVSQGSMMAVQNKLVTCLELDDDYLWVGTSDGLVQAFALDHELPLALQSSPELKWDFGSPVLSLSLLPDIGCGVVSTVSGVRLFSMEDDEEATPIMQPPFDINRQESSVTFALCSTIVCSTENDERTFSVACGGNDGSLFLQPLSMQSHDEVDWKKPFVQPVWQLKPRHSGAVQCMTSPAPGLLVTASQDGTMRVWDIAQRNCMYQFIGYKVWLGSVWSDGVRLISDGSDNTVIAHNFDPAVSEKTELE
ncbi:predicted protein [Phaeodactylum tricornutum CCAP 1055/1]|uniref:Uncharacterized protein n=1 Tax=Phaeodactylum tricornutum (strain CCAP 1055/1) TaxID=556484 RepID=B7G5I8_PHATC|nr:predicted protein [Phaeodactylum tricornutum CCAP 1055/1]EEC46323.1 predicted protein [Phaeodactylum tricornutum CCAP 1055/1]|eukprot:XP_002182422.1 predicted protein [Phaeodactylum tricornutum CCAP 1055/1]